MARGNQRKNIKIGLEVAVVQKHHQRTGELTEGFVKRILTKSAQHPHGIKVMLDTGEVGRVKEILEEADHKR
ncbi:MAG: YwbE family protein [Bacteroidota bacterium]